MLNNLETAQATRRGFLGAAALTAAQYKRVLGANDRIGIGFIGFGLIGKQHITDFKKFDDVDIVGLCDVYKPRVEEGLKYTGNPNAKGYSDFRKMYDEIEKQMPMAEIERAAATSRCPSWRARSSRQVRPSRRHRRRKK